MSTRSNVKFYIDGYSVPVLSYTEQVHQQTDFNGMPSATPQTGIYRVVVPDTGRWTHLLDDWALSRTMRKECKIEEQSFDGYKMFKTLEFQGAFCIELQYIDGGIDGPMYSLLISTPIVIRNGELVVSKWWRENDPLPANQPVEEVVEQRNPEILKGWWSHDKAGKDLYIPQDKDRGKIPLGETVYFHVQTRGVSPREELQFQLYDYDHFLWMDSLKTDTSEFPNDPVTKTATVDNHGIATVELLLDESWEPVINEDDDNFSAPDTVIELYWKVRYNDNDTTIDKELPTDNEHYLQVSYSKHDLFIKPITEGTGLPEFYTNDGKLIIFTFKMAEKIATELVPNPYLSSFFMHTIRITEKQTLSSINTVKKHLLYESVSWDTNKSVRFGYTTTASSNFIIKGKASWETVTEFDVKTKKKFSDYFNRRDIKNAGVIGLKKIRKAIKILDFINATKAVTSIFKKPEEGLQIPNPSSIITGMGLIPAIARIPGFGELVPLFMAADVISTKVVNEILNDFSNEAMLEWQRRKLKGLNSALAWVQTQNEGAKMLGLDYIEFVSQEAYEKLLSGEFKSFNELDEYKPSIEDNNNNYYTCFYYIKKENGRKKYLIDSIVLR